MSCTSLRSGSDPMTHFRMGLGCHLMPLRWGSNSITPDHRFMPSALESLSLSSGAKVMALSGDIYWGISRVEIILTLTLFLASTFISTRGRAHESEGHEDVRWASVVVRALRRTNTLYIRPWECYGMPHEGPLGGLASLRFADSGSPRVIEGGTIGGSMASLSPKKQMWLNGLDAQVFYRAVLYPPLAK
ncbi:hypothetical protein B296_00046576 [Ensete ventricosum]|uniref:Uncharacterized protein n=1 Tax=Ensete ventricosum TaxID=4639 RepID=A0A426Z3D8_ENSVE|nr:hypothetical protein B296_00046576 [Ensete ventricosum]